MKWTRLAGVVGAILLVPSALIFDGPDAVAQQEPEVVLTSDFEDGTTQGWFGRGSAVLDVSDTQAAGGTYSLLTTGRTSGWHGPARNVLPVLQTGGVYGFEAQVRLLEGSQPQQILMTMQHTPASSGTTGWQSIAVVEGVTDDQWVTIAGQYTPAEPMQALEVYLESNDSTVSFYADDIVVTLLEPPPSVDPPPPGSVELRPESTQQTIEGFGYASAFQRAVRLHQLSEPQRSEALDLLLGRDGASPDIIRLGIGGQSHDTYDVMLSIQPEDPGGPNAEPNYQWDGWDNGQVWFANEAQQRGVERFFGNAWSAPGYMKTNGSPTDGGTLCGLSGAPACQSGDWTDAYAAYLVAWADFYAQEGIDIESIAFTNEPDYTTSYESMRFTPAQATEFTKILGPVAEDAGYGVICCESFGWNQGRPYLTALNADPEALQYISAYSAHSYASRSDTPVETDVPVWMSEWASSSVAGGWNEAWDGSGHVTDVFLLAAHIHDSLVGANLNAYLWWLGISVGGSASLLLADVANDTYHVSARYYAFSAFSRFIEPGAVRYDTSTDLDGLKVSAYANPDGSEVVQLLNMTHFPISADINLAHQPTSYLTDDDHNLELVDFVTTTGDGVTELQLPARSLTTLVTEPASVTYDVEIETTGDGTVTGAGAYQPGDTVTVTAAPAESQVWEGWTSPELEWIGARVSTFTMPERDVTLTTSFRPEMGALKEIYADYFDVGNIHSGGQTYAPGSPNSQSVARHYSIMTAENGMKPDALLPNNNIDPVTGAFTFNFTNADAFVNQTLARDMKVHGHVLVWHSQSPARINSGSTGGTRQLARENMRRYIEEVLTHFSGRIETWDVVNEAFIDGLDSFDPETQDWRDYLRGGPNGGSSNWYSAYANGADVAAGEGPGDFIYDAFVFARQYGPEVKLEYNDFNVFQSEGKGKAIVAMARELNERYAAEHPDDPRPLIEAIGMQSHNYINQTPAFACSDQTVLPELVDDTAAEWQPGSCSNLASVEASIQNIIEAGLDVAISELDLMIWQAWNGQPEGSSAANYRDLTDPSVKDRYYRDGFTYWVGKISNRAELEAIQAQRYAEFFAVYKKYSEHIDRVTFWGLTDRLNWRATHNPLFLNSDWTEKLSAAAIADPDTWLGLSEPSLDVSVAAGTRCVAGRVMVTVQVSNNDSVPVSAQAVTDYGSRSFPSVQPGKNAFHAFATRQSSVPAGTVSVEVSATVHGDQVTLPIDAAYAESSCS
jgi:endo-1,4-beta-xylanase